MIKNSEFNIEAIAIGTSAGGLQAMETILSRIPGTLICPIFVVQHLHASQDGYFADHLNNLCAMTVKIAEDKEPIQPGVVYYAPPNYHLLIEEDKTCSLSVDGKINYSRPSIDVLFESAADVYGRALAGILLTGANNDGAKGLLDLQSQGGYAVVQNPQNAAHPVMPQSAMDLFTPDAVLSLEEIGAFLSTFCQPKA